ncbi:MULTISPECIES: hypothetical protein [unclassified Nocardioides]|uniref:hypothetical protein n=1 Tax=unclassified Nocardioides TaxID=2615069 RepID=UPI0006F463A6|nr:MULTISPECIES: hypothetical protein [unclassified Nocardioides]KRA31237.1 hypothetical protein ASD81_17395 [Nocardioides sp. Root614]KRA87859.1 hypothetical protein ASD84_17670 [Nocardioides sp. Root682]
MTDLTDRLRKLNHEAETTDAIIKRDVMRGRGAARRRTVRMGVAGLGIAAVAAVGVTVAVNADQPSAPPVVQPSQQGETLELVAYTGEQEPGFIVSKVPEGFVLEGSGPFNLNIARPDNLTGLDNFVEKVVVMLESSSVTGAPEGTPVKVGDHDGWLRASDAATILTYDDGANRVLVQVWDSLGLTDDQIIELAEGVTVTAEAQAGVG